MAKHSNGGARLVHHVARQTHKHTKAYEGGSKGNLHTHKEFRLEAARQPGRGACCPRTHQQHTPSSGSQSDPCCSTSHLHAGIIALVHWMQHCSNTNQKDAQQTPKRKSKKTARRQ